MTGHHSNREARLRAYLDKRWVRWKGEDYDFARDVLAQVEATEQMGEFITAHTLVDKGVTDFDLHGEAVERLRTASELPAVRAVIYDALTTDRQCEAVSGEADLASRPSGSAGLGLSTADPASLPCPKCRGVGDVHGVRCWRCGGSGDLPPVPPSAGSES